MKRLITILSIAAVAGGVAHAADFKTSCTRGNDSRIVEVVAPGEVGSACDVRYFKGANRAPTTPFHADNSENFCMQKANELINTLATAGYECALADGVADVAAAPAPAPAPAASIVADAQSVPDADQEIVAQAAQIEPPVEAAPEAAELEDKMNAILDSPEQEAAIRGPSNLTDNAVETIAGGQPSPAVGRIVGAAPDEPAAVAEASTLAAEPVTQAAVRDELVQPQPGETPVATANAEAPRVVEPTPAAVPAPAAQPIEKASGRTPLRSVEDVVRATLRAQAAAWNEGNLDAFMDTYWKDDGLKFVSGAQITKGWSATMKRYRERYADSAGLGQLGFGEMDVELVTDDVAVVTGRFSHVKNDAPTSGLFSLVMRRDRGAWRIVHDHTVVDATPDE